MSDKLSETVQCAYVHNYYRIVSEVDSTRSRRSLLAVSAFNHTSVTLEFGNPPAVNISMTPPPSIEEEIEMAREVNDSVDLEVRMLRYSCLRMWKTRLFPS